MSLCTADLPFHEAIKINCLDFQYLKFLLLVFHSCFFVHKVKFHSGFIKKVLFLIGKQ